MHCTNFYSAEIPTCYVCLNKIWQKKKKHAFIISYAWQNNIIYVLKLMFK
jgi:hypothetical protein